MSRRQKTHILLAGIALISFYMASYGMLRAHLGGNAAWGEKSHARGIWDLPPLMLSAIAGEFKGLFADFLTLEAGAQLGTAWVRTPEGGFRMANKEPEWPTVHRIFVASQALDPSFAQTYLVAQGYLPWDAGMVEESQGILRTAAVNRPWDWQPMHMMGFNCYYFLDQPGEAGKFFLEAAQVPDAPSFLAILGSRLAQKGGETEAAIGLMKTMLVTKDESDPGYKDMVDRLHALEGVLILERAVQQYEREYARKPDDLADLTASGILASLPPNPYGLPYCLDEEGALHFDKPECRRSAPPSPAPSSS